MNQLFTKDQSPRSKNIKRMHVRDAGNHPCGGKVIEFQCKHCKYNTGWIKDSKTITENKKGLPCPKCNQVKEVITKPAFLPLDTEFYMQFKSGLKTDEFRLFGGIFTEKNFYPGRRIILSKGYGNYDRTAGVIEVFSIKDLHELSPKDQKDVLSCYGEKAKTQPIAVIRIKIDER